MSGSNVVSTVGGGIDDGQKVFNLINSITDFFARLLRSKKQKNAVVSSLKDSFGEWTDEAKDPQGRWRQPFLESKAFEKHLKNAKGELQPTGDLTASFAWAALLYALNIRPGMKILSWRPVSRENDPTTTSLIIDGTALCHIINIYQLYTTTSSRPSKEFEACRFPFGNLKADDKVLHSFQFISGSLEELSSLRRPFQYKLQDRGKSREDHLNFDDGGAKAYFDALDHGVSDENGRLENAQTSLTGRVDSLLRAMDLLNQCNWDKAYLVTASWIEEASRVKRRTTTEGVDDDCLVDYICKRISDEPGLVSSLKNPLRREDLWETEFESSVIALCMYQKDKFEFRWETGGMFPSDKNAQFEAELQRHLPGILATLTVLREGSWGNLLSTLVIPSDLMRVMKLPHVIVNRPVILLQLVPAEWEFTGEIMG